MVWRKGGEKKLDSGINVFSLISNPEKDWRIFFGNKSQETSGFKKDKGTTNSSITWKSKTIKGQRFTN